MKFFLLYILLGSLFFSCQLDQPDKAQSKIQKIMLLEQSLIDNKKFDQDIIADELILLLEKDELLKENKKKTLLAIVEKIKYEDYNIESMEIIGILKNEYLTTTPEKDPFIRYFWQFGSDLSMVAKTGYDPMLDLYEWNEFMSQLDCMKTSWQSWKKSISGRNFQEIYGEEFLVYFKNLESSVENYIRDCESDKLLIDGLSEASEELYQQYAQFLAFLNDSYTLTNDHLM